MVHVSSKWSHIYHISGQSIYLTLISIFSCFVLYLNVTQSMCVMVTSSLRMCYSHRMDGCTLLISPSSSLLIYQKWVIIVVVTRLKQSTVYSIPYTVLSIFSGRSISVLVLLRYKSSSNVLYRPREDSISSWVQGKRRTIVHQANLRYTIVKFW